MRCLTLANALHEKGAEITFICREHPGHLFDLIESSNHRLLRLPLSKGSTEGRLAHAHWLGATQEEDAQQTIEVLTKTIGHIDWLVIDHYALGVEWETALRAYAERIMVIDDLADRVHDCDMLLDQNFYRDMERRYEKLVPPRCKKLLGPKYVLLRPEFKEARSNLKVRDGSVKRIFVFFGGSDLTNETGKTLRAIQQLSRTDIAIDVVVGAANPHLEDIASFCATLPEAKLYRQINNMAELMARDDLAIGAGGSSMWERCYLELPALTTVSAANQERTTQDVADTGAIEYLGWADQLDSSDYARAIAEMVENPQRVRRIGSKAIKLMQQTGASVSEAMSNYV